MEIYNDISTFAHISLYLFCNQSIISGAFTVNRRKTGEKQAKIQLDFTIWGRRNDGLITHRSRALRYLSLHWRWSGATPDKATYDRSRALIPNHGIMDQKMHESNQLLFSNHGIMDQKIHESNQSMHKSNQLLFSNHGIMDQGYQSNQIMNQIFDSWINFDSCIDWFDSCIDRFDSCIDWFESSIGSCINWLINWLITHRSRALIPR